MAQRLLRFPEEKQLSQGHMESDRNQNLEVLTPPDSPLLSSHLSPYLHSDLFLEPCARLDNTTHCWRWGPWLAAPSYPHVEFSAFIPRLDLEDVIGPRVAGRRLHLEDVRRNGSSWHHIHIPVQDGEGLVSAAGILSGAHTAAVGKGNRLRKWLENPLQLPVVPTSSRTTLKRRLLHFYHPNDVIADSFCSWLSSKNSQRPGERSALLPREWPVLAR